MTEQNTDVETPNQEVETNSHGLDLSQDDRDLLERFGIDPEEASLNDLISIARRAHGAEEKIVKEKKEKKLAPKSTPEKSEETMTKAEYAMERFIDKNPELQDYREDLEKYVKKGNSLEEAKILVLNSDKSIENRKKLEEMNITEGEPNNKTTYTKAQLEKLPQKKYEEVKKLMKEGKVRIV